MSARRHPPAGFIITGETPVKYTLELTGTVGLRTEGKSEQPVTYELMFDHMKFEVDGLDAVTVADALSVAMKTGDGAEPEVRRGLPRAALPLEGRQAAEQMLALTEAWALLATESEDDQVILDSRHLAQRLLRDAGLRPSMTKDEVQRAAQLLHANGELSNAFLLGAAE